MCHGRVHNWLVGLSRSTVPMSFAAVGPRDAAGSSYRVHAALCLFVQLAQLGSTLPMARERKDCCTSHYYLPGGGEQAWHTIPGLPRQGAEGGQGMRVLSATLMHCTGSRGHSR